MNKIWCSLGLAVLGIALLVGCVSAGSTGEAAVSGCLQTDDYVLDTSSLTASPSLGYLPAATSVSGGSLGVLAKPAWKLTVVETGASPTGHMKLSVSPNTPLTDPLYVNSNALGATATTLDSGTDTACVVDTTNIGYTQTKDDLDTTQGSYTISLTYTLGANV